MIALLEDALDAGALGLSSGLFTAPGSYAQPAEMIALCRVVKRHNGGYFTHIRDEANQVLDAIEEAIAIAEACGVHVEIVHFKCSGTDNWGKAARALDMIAAGQGARARRRLRFLSLCRRQQSAQEPDAAMGAGRAASRRCWSGSRSGRRRESHPRGHCPRRPQQLGPPPVVGLRADLDLAQSAAACRTHDRLRSRASAARIRSIPSPTI